MTVRRGFCILNLSMLLLASQAYAQNSTVYQANEILSVRWREKVIKVNDSTDAQNSTVEQVDEILTVEWRRKVINVKDSTVVFSGGVVARYGPTVLHSDSLTISQKPGNRLGKAEGAIRLDDPDGTLTAELLEFNWETRMGQAKDVVLDVEGLNVRARHAELRPEEWIFMDVIAAPDGSKNPLLQLRSPRVSYRPGQSGVARKASLYGFGAKLITLPSYRFGSKREEQSLRFPSISFNQGFGISWRTAVPVDDRSRFNGSIRAKTGEGPGIGAQFTRSFLPRNEPEGVISPIPELNERFTYGFFDNIYITEPKEERSQISARRGSVAIGTTVNELAVGRINRDLYTKAIEVVFEQARPFDDIAFYSSLRYHDIREDGGLSERRAMASATTLLPEIHFGGGLKTHSRVDVSGYVGDRNTFGWGTAQLGLIYEPTQQLRIGAAYVRGRELGTPTFAADRLFSLSGYHLRLDADFGSTRFSYLTKYDTNRRKWFDNEFTISQTIGSVIPFISYREFPRAFTFGVKLKAEETLAKLSERFRRGNKKKPN